MVVGWTVGYVLEYDGIWAKCQILVGQKVQKVWIVYKRKMWG